MERLDAIEKESEKEIQHLNDKISHLKKENQYLREENQLLCNDHARMKSILDNNRSNTSQPPSTDQKGGKPVNLYNSRKHSKRISPFSTNFKYIYYIQLCKYNKIEIPLTFSKLHL